MSGINSAAVKVNDLGVIKELELPSSWHRAEQRSQFGRAVVFSGTMSPTTQIRFFERTRTIEENSAKVFCHLVSADGATPRLLYTASGANSANLAIIKALAGAFGSNQVGDNQITAPQIEPDARRPAFHLETARVDTINGKTVIAVDGWFTQSDNQAEIKIDPDGPAKRYYSGIFVSADQKAERIFEIYMIADNKNEYVLGKAAFSSMLRSIQWQC